MCVTLHCLKPDGYCESNDEPAADGTICGFNDDMVPILLSSTSIINETAK